MQFIQLVRTSDGHNVMLCHGKTGNDTPCYAFIACTEEKTKALKIDYAQKDNIHDLSKYGTVIYMASGEKPDEKAHKILENWLMVNC